MDSYSHIKFHKIDLNPDFVYMRDLFFGKSKNI